MPVELESNAPTNESSTPPQPTPGATGEQAQTFTQEDLNRIVSTRLAQERQKFSDYDDLKAKVQAAEDATKTEAQRAAERIQALEAQNQQLAEKSRVALVKAAITEAAAAAGLPAEAAYRLVDQNALTVDANGTVQNAADLVKAVATAYPGLLRTPTPKVNAANPPRSGELTGRTDGQRMREYFGGGGANFWDGGGVRMPDNS